MRIGPSLSPMLLFGAFGIWCLASQANAQEIQSTKCELHVWPTRAISATFTDATGFSGTIISATMNDVSRRLAEAIGPEQQIAEINSMDLGSMPRFSGYRIVTHEVPMPSWVLNPASRDIEKAVRSSESKSQCYAELHVLSINLLRMPIGKVIYSGFLFRDFGSSQIAESNFYGEGGAGAPGFESNGLPKSEAAKKSVRDAFLKNLRTFLHKKKMRAKA